MAPLAAAVVLIAAVGVVFASGLGRGSEFEGHWIRTDKPDWYFDINRSGFGFRLTDEDGVTLQASLQGNELHTEPILGVTVIFELVGDSLYEHLPSRTYELRRPGADSASPAEAESANLASGAAPTTQTPTLQAPTTRATAPTATTSARPEAGDISSPGELAECDDASALDVNPGELQPGENTAEVSVAAEPDCWSGWVRLPQGTRRLWVWPEPEQAADVNLSDGSLHTVDPRTVDPVVSLFLPDGVSEIRVRSRLPSSTVRLVLGIWRDY